MKDYSDIDKALPGLNKEYRFGTLERKDMAANPLEQFARWLEDAVKANTSKPDAMVVSTASAKGKPGSRVLLLKGFNKDGFLFYTNYDSPKADDLADNPRASLLFFWPEQERQVRVDGRVKKISRIESEKYFRTRSRDAQLASWISEQSRVIAGRKELEKKLETFRKKFDTQEIPCPPFWGGYRLIPSTFEFWQGREYRLNDRFHYRKKGKTWHIKRLQP